MAAPYVEELAAGLLIGDAFSDDGEQASDQEGPSRVVADESKRADKLFYVCDVASLSKRELGLCKWSTGTSKTATATFFVRCDLKNGAFLGFWPPPHVVADTAAASSSGSKKATPDESEGKAAVEAKLAIVHTTLTAGEFGFGARVQPNEDENSPKNIEQGDSEMLSPAANGANGSNAPVAHHQEAPPQAGAPAVAAENNAGGDVSSAGNNTDYPGDRAKTTKKVDRVLEGAVDPWSWRLLAYGAAVTGSTSLLSDCVYGKKISAQDRDDFYDYTLLSVGVVAEKTQIVEFFAHDLLGYHCEHIELPPERNMTTLEGRVLITHLACVLFAAENSFDGETALSYAIRHGLRTIVRDILTSYEMVKCTRMLHYIKLGAETTWRAETATGTSSSHPSKQAEKNRWVTLERDRTTEEDRKKAQELQKRFASGVEVETTGSKAQEQHTIHTEPLLRALYDLLADPSRRSLRMRRLVFPLMRVLQIGNTVCCSNKDDPSACLYDLTKLQGYFSAIGGGAPWWGPVIATVPRFLLPGSGSPSKKRSMPASSTNLVAAAEYEAEVDFADTISRLESESFKRFCNNSVWRRCVSLANHANGWSPEDVYEEIGGELDFMGRQRALMNEFVVRFCSKAVAMGATDALLWFARKVAPVLDVPIRSSLVLSLQENKLRGNKINLGESAILGVTDIHPENAATVAFELAGMLGLANPEQAASARKSDEKFFEELFYSGTWKGKTSFQAKGLAAEEKMLKMRKKQAKIVSASPSAIGSYENFSLEQLNNNYTCKSLPDLVKVTNHSIDSEMVTATGRKLSDVSAAVQRREAKAAAASRGRGTAKKFKTAEARLQALLKDLHAKDGDGHDAARRELLHTALQRVTEDIRDSTAALQDLFDTPTPTTVWSAFLRCYKEEEKRRGVYHSIVSKIRDSTFGYRTVAVFESMVYPSLDFERVDLHMSGLRSRAAFGVRRRLARLLHPEGVQLHEKVDKRAIFLASKTTEGTITVRGVKVPVTENTSEKFKTSLLAEMERERLKLLETISRNLLLVPRRWRPRKLRKFPYDGFVIAAGDSSGEDDFCSDSEDESKFSLVTMRKMNPVENADRRYREVLAWHKANFVAPDVAKIYRVKPMKEAVADLFRLYLQQSLALAAVTSVQDEENEQQSDAGPAPKRTKNCRTTPAQMKKKSRSSTSFAQPTTEIVKQFKMTRAGIMFEDLPRLFLLLTIDHHAFFRWAIQEKWIDLSTEIIPKNFYEEEVEDGGEHSERQARMADHNKGTNSETEEHCCPICLETLTEKNQYRALCGHRFCRACAFQELVQPCALDKNGIVWEVTNQITTVEADGTKKKTVTLKRIGKDGLGDYGEDDGADEQQQALENEAQGQEAAPAALNVEAANNDMQVEDAGAGPAVVAEAVLGQDEAAAVVVQPPDAPVENEFEFYDIDYLDDALPARPIRSRTLAFFYLPREQKNESGSGPGNKKCPVCREPLKPGSLSDAFALQLLVSGIWRSRRETQRLQPFPAVSLCSKVEGGNAPVTPGTTLGEALVSLAAACGAVSTLQVLLEEGEDTIRSCSAGASCAKASTQNNNKCCLAADSAREMCCGASPLWFASYFNRQTVLHWWTHWARKDQNAGGKYVTTDRLRESFVALHSAPSTEAILDPSAILERRGKVVTYCGAVLSSTGMTPLQTLVMPRKSKESVVRADLALDYYALALGKPVASTLRDGDRNKKQAVSGGEQLVPWWVSYIDETSTDQKIPNIPETMPDTLIEVVSRVHELSSSSSSHPPFRQTESLRRWNRLLSCLSNAEKVREELQQAAGQYAMSWPQENPLFLWSYHLAKAQPAGLGAVFPKEFNLWSMMLQRKPATDLLQVIDAAKILHQVGDIFQEAGESKWTLQAYSFCSFLLVLLTNPAPQNGKLLRLLVEQRSSTFSKALKECGGVLSEMLVREIRDHMEQAKDDEFTEELALLKKVNKFAGHTLAVFTDTPVVAIYRFLVLLAVLGQPRCRDQVADLLIGKTGAGGRLLQEQRRRTLQMEEQERAKKAQNAENQKDLQELQKAQYEARCRQIYLSAKQRFQDIEAEALAGLPAASATLLKDLRAVSQILLRRRALRCAGYPSAARIAHDWQSFDMGATTTEYGFQRLVCLILLDESELAASLVQEVQSSRSTEKSSSSTLLPREQTHETAPPDPSASPSSPPAKKRKLDDASASSSKPHATGGDAEDPLLSFAEMTARGWDRKRIEKSVSHYIGRPLQNLDAAFRKKVFARETIAQLADLTLDDSKSTSASSTGPGASSADKGHDHFGSLIVNLVDFPTRILKSRSISYSAQKHEGLVGRKISRDIQNLIHKYDIDCERDCGPDCAGVLNGTPRAQKKKAEELWRTLGGEESKKKKLAATSYLDAYAAARRRKVSSLGFLLRQRRFEQAEMLFDLERARDVARPPKSPEAKAEAAEQKKKKTKLRKMKRREKRDAAADVRRQRGVPMGEGANTATGEREDPTKTHTEDAEAAPPARRPRLMSPGFVSDDSDAEEVYSAAEDTDEADGQSEDSTDDEDKEHYPPWRDVTEYMPMRYRKGWRDRVWYERVLDTYLYEEVVCEQLLKKDAALMGLSPAQGKQIQSELEWIADYLAKTVQIGMLSFAPVAKSSEGTASTRPYCLWTDYSFVHGGLGLGGRYSREGEPLFIFFWQLILQSEQRDGMHSRLAGLDSGRRDLTFSYGSENEECSSLYFRYNPDCKVLEEEFGRGDQRLGVMLKELRKSAGANKKKCAASAGAEEETKPRAKQATLGDDELFLAVHVARLMKEKREAERIRLANFFSLMQFVGKKIVQVGGKMALLTIGIQRYLDGDDAASNGSVDESNLALLWRLLPRTVRQDGKVPVALLLRVVVLLLELLSEPVDATSFEEPTSSPEGRHSDERSFWEEKSESKQLLPLVLTRSLHDGDVEETHFLPRYPQKQFQTPGERILYLDSRFSPVQPRYEDYMWSQTDSEAHQDPHRLLVSQLLSPEDDSEGHWKQWAERETRSGRSPVPDPNFTHYWTGENEPSFWTLEKLEEAARDIQDLVSSTNVKTTPAATASSKTSSSILTDKQDFTLTAAFAVRFLVLRCGLDVQHLAIDELHPDGSDGHGKQLAYEDSQSAKQMTRAELEQLRMLQWQQPRKRTYYL
ncbi:unnamed protein product [Amoebophrya sp. A120]|nr:unnamed protein product [Amoebophrya sp. A120]|eukprot:GSA120T00004991001.1